MGGVSIVVPIALAAFVLAVAALFSFLEPRRAAISALLGGMLLLPVYDGRLAVPVLHTKAMFVPTVVLLASVAFDARRWRSLRPSLLDLPMLAHCAVPFLSALANGLGAKEAGSAALEATLTWGAPYLIARKYLGGRRGVQDLAFGIVTAAAFYVPLCLWEIRMSPQLHAAVYGFRTWTFDQALRGGGYRPAVFMQHGLALGMFLAVASLIAVWLWRTRASTRLGGIPLSAVAALLVVTTVLSRSSGAIALLTLGLLVLEGTRVLRTPLLLVALAATPPAYCAARLSGWDGRVVVQAARSLSEERAASVAFRMANEDLLMRRAMLRPWLGWGRFGRSFVRDADTGELLTVVDGLWIIVLGYTGLIGLAATGLAIALPPVALLRARSASGWSTPGLAPAAGLAVGLLAWGIDNLLNAMPSPMFPTIAGAITSLVLLPRARRTKRARAPRALALARGSSTSRVRAG